MKFYKYHGAGNDFIIIDDRNNSFPSINIELINHLCDRRFGIGADGLMLLQNENGFDFKMVYFNADGNESTMCGNGGRCIVHFANHLNIIQSKTKFIAIDGEHLAEIDRNIVDLKMIDVNSIDKLEKDFWLNTGSPHYIQFTSDLDNFDVFTNGKNIRNSSQFVEEGTNVNFVEKLKEDTIKIRTYERGVEDETLACGTGVTAAAIVFGNENNQNHIKVKAVGGDLEVRFKKLDNKFTDVWLKGPAEMVFEGDINI